MNFKEECSVEGCDARIERWARIAKKTMSISDFNKFVDLCEAHIRHIKDDMYIE